MTSNNLKSLEARHIALLTLAESYPVGSVERQQAMKAADRILALINDLHERAHPTPLV